MLNNRLVDYTAFRQICLAWKSVKLVQLTFASLQRIKICFVVL